MEFRDLVRLPPSLTVDMCFQATKKAINDAEEKVLREFAAEHPGYPDEVEIALVTEFEDGKVITRLGMPAIEVKPGNVVQVINMGAPRKAIAIHDETGGG